jgi:hypothetical protein
MVYREIFKELDTTEYKGKRIMKILEELYSYISVYISIQTLDKGYQLLLDILKSLQL